MALRLLCCGVLHEQGPSALELQRQRLRRVKKE
jgi:hypothetical protein